jgi:aminoglycoside 2'-N-acetyltransferase I
VPTVRLAHTSQLEAATLGAARAMLEEAFGGGFDADDWDHALGGLHALVHDGDRRRGFGSALMEPLEAVVRSAYDLGALGATDAGAALYLSRGWQPWRGPTATLAPGGTVPTPDDDGSVLVLPGAVPLDLDDELACDWRDGDVW